MSNTNESAEEVVNTPALLGGPKSVTGDPGDMFDWPIVTQEDEQALLDVLRKGAMSGTDVTRALEMEFADWMGTDYALGFNNGTASIQSSFFACKIGRGDEVICPSITFWASVLPLYSLGATPVFADIDPNTLCLDPGDIEHRVSKNTKAIIVTHYNGHPADMDPILEIAGRHGLRVIEDVSHAHGALYKGRKTGTLGHAGVMSMMSGKALPAGEAGMLVTDDLEIYERASAWGHYTRNRNLQTEELKPFEGLPLGGYKYRMNQISAALARTQLRHYDERNREILKSMHYFWDLLEGVPGVRPHRPARDSNIEMGGWYSARGLYRSEELGGLSVTRFAEAVRAEGCSFCKPGANLPLHLHPLLNTFDAFHDGRPTRVAHTDRDVRQPHGSLPVSEGIGEKVYTIPWFKHHRPKVIEEHAAAFRKVCLNYKVLLEGDEGNPQDLGSWSSFEHNQKNRRPS